jgi:hypothetical protein
MLCIHFLTCLLISSCSKHEIIQVVVNLMETEGKTNRLCKMSPLMQMTDAKSGLRYWTSLTFLMRHRFILQSMQALRILTYGWKKIPMFRVKLPYILSRLECGAQWPSTKTVWPIFSQTPWILSSTLTQSINFLDTSLKRNWQNRWQQDGTTSHSKSECVYTCQEYINSA